MDSTVIPFPTPVRQKSCAQITAVSKGLPSACQLVHNQKSLSIDGVIDMPHQWQQGEIVIVIYHKNRAIVTGCEAQPDNRFNLDVQMFDGKTNLVFGEDQSGEKADLCCFLGNEADLTMSSNPKNRGYYFNFDTIDNKGFWCLLLLGYKLDIR